MGDRSGVSVRFNFALLYRKKQQEDVIYSTPISLLKKPVLFRSACLQHRTTLYIHALIFLAKRVENKMKVSESIRYKQKTMLVRSLYADSDFLPDKTVFKPEIGFLVNRTRLFFFFLKLPLSFCTSSIPKWAKSRNNGKP